MRHYATERTRDIEQGRRIKAMRIMRGLHQEELADLAGVARKTLWRAEQGFRMFRPTREAIMRALGVPVPGSEPTEPTP